MKNIATFLIFIFVFAILLGPAVSFAQQLSPYEAAKKANPVPDKECYPPDGTKPGDDDALIKCGRKVVCEYQLVLDEKTTPPTYKKAMPPVIVRTVDPADLCNFDDVMETINRIINFVLFGLAIPIVGIMFAYAGFTLITAGGDNAGARTKAKSIFINAVIGLVLAFTAYLIVVFLLKTLGYNGSWIFDTF